MRYSVSLFRHPYSKNSSNVLVKGKWRSVALAERAASIAPIGCDPHTKPHLPSTSLPIIGYSGVFVECSFPQLCFHLIREHLHSSRNIIWTSSVQFRNRHVLSYLCLAIICHKKRYSLFCFAQNFL